MRLLTALAKLALFLAMAAFLTGASLFVLGGYILAWPILRQSPRGRKKQAMMQLATAVFALILVLQPAQDEDTTPNS